MNYLLTVLFVFICLFSFSQSSEEQQKAAIFTKEYLDIDGLHSKQIQAVDSNLKRFFSNQVKGIPYSASIQNEVTNKYSQLNTALGPLTATALQLSISGNLSNTNHTYNRVYNTVFYPLNPCQTQGVLTTMGTNVFYNIIEFIVTIPGRVDIEVVSADFDSFLSLYCTFDPLHPHQNVMWTDDDSGVGSLSKMVNLDLSKGKYYLVISSFGNGETGNYSVEFKSNNATIKGGIPIPLNIWWFTSLFIFILLGILFRRKQKSIYN